MPLLQSAAGEIGEGCGLPCGGYGATPVQDEGSAVFGGGRTSEVSGPCCCAGGGGTSPEIVAAGTLATAPAPEDDALLLDGCTSGRENQRLAAISSVTTSPCSLQLRPFHTCSILG